MSAAAGAGPLEVKVTVHDVWDAQVRAVPRDQPAGVLKAEALAQARVPHDPSLYVLKFRGAEVLDESLTLAELGATDRSQFIVLSRRRRPVR